MHQINSMLLLLLSLLFAYHQFKKQRKIQCLQKKLLFIIGGTGAIGSSIWQSRSTNLNYNPILNRKK